jgi:hypothetical protein
MNVDVKAGEYSTFTKAGGTIYGDSDNTHTPNIQTSFKLWI